MRVNEQNLIKVVVKVIKAGNGASDKVCIGLANDFFEDFRDAVEFALNDHLASNKDLHEFDLFGVITRVIIEKDLYNK